MKLHGFLGTQVKERPFCAVVSKGKCWVVFFIGIDVADGILGGGEGEKPAGRKKYK